GGTFSPAAGLLRTIKAPLSPFNSFRQITPSHRRHIPVRRERLLSHKYRFTSCNYRTYVLSYWKEQMFDKEKRWIAMRDRVMKEMSLYEKLNILSDAAKYDVSCSSSGVERRGDGTGMGNCRKAGICHSFSSDGRCISLLKILFTNECIYDCKYCINRSSNDVVRTSFTPEEICTLTMEFYRRNYIEGLFLSSGILKSPNYTMELIYAALYRLRHVYNFQGYIHVKAIPGADP